MKAKTYQRCMQNNLEEHMTAKEIENIIHEYGDDIYRFCYYLTSSRDMADELYQETFLKAVQLSNKLNKSDNIKSFLMGIAANLWKNLMRKTARRKAIIPEANYEENIARVQDDNIDILETYVENEMLREIRIAVDNLPVKQRIVVILHYCEDVSTEEIGRILHIPKGTVLSRLSKARKILKKEMEMKGYEV